MMLRRDFVGKAMGTAGAGLLAGCGSSGSAVRPAAASPALPANDPVRLTSNENPLGLSPAGRRAILDELGRSHLYPLNRQPLLQALANRHGLSPAHVQPGTGSTEILQMVVQASAPDAVVVTGLPTFEDVSRYAAAAGRRLVAVPLRPDGAHDLEAMRAAAGDGPALIFICNPNNPTGTITPSADIDTWIAAAPDRLTFVIDEAYFEFAEDPRYTTATPWVSRRTNVIVVRTFSKLYGMAGLRLGYAVAAPATSQRLRLQACANGVNALAMAAALASLADASFAQRTLSSNRASRRIVVEALESLGIPYLPSQTNFIMHEIRGELPAYNDRMRTAGFLVGRPFPPMLGHSRVSLGLPDDMRRFAGTLHEFRRNGWL